MSEAIAPPTVTNLVPGVTGTNQPRGTLSRRMSSRLIPAGAVTMPVEVSSEYGLPTAVPGIMRTCPPAFWAAAPYERPRPRAMTPRSPAEQTTSRTWASSAGTTVSATVHAVRPQPDSLCFVTAPF